MNRRKFFGLGFVAAAMSPTAALEAAHAATAGPVGRVSVVEGEPGYREYCIARGDGKTVRAILDGVNITDADAADAIEGWVRRCVRTPKGNIAHDGRGNILMEVVYGAVRIEII